MHLAIPVLTHITMPFVLLSRLLSPSMTYISRDITLFPWKCNKSGADIGEHRQPLWMQRQTTHNHIPPLHIHRTQTIPHSTHNTSHHTKCTHTQRTIAQTHYHHIHYHHTVLPTTPHHTQTTHTEQYIKFLTQHTITTTHCSDTWLEVMYLLYIHRHGMQQPKQAAHGWNWVKRCAVTLHLVAVSCVTHFDKKWTSSNSIAVLNSTLNWHICTL